MAIDEELNQDRGTCFNMQRAEGPGKKTDAGLEDKTSDYAERLKAVEEKYGLDGFDGIYELRNQDYCKAINDGFKKRDIGFKKDSLLDRVYGAAGAVMGAETVLLYAAAHFNEAPLLVTVGTLAGAYAGKKILQKTVPYMWAGMLYAGLKAGHAYRCHIKAPVKRAYKKTIGRAVNFAKEKLEDRRQIAKNRRKFKQWKADGFTVRWDNPRERPCIIRDYDITISRRYVTFDKNFRRPDYTDD